MHYITCNLMHPISNLSVTLDNVSYYIMHSGTCDFGVPTLCTAAVLLLCPRQEQVLRCMSGLLSLWERTVWVENRLT